PRVPEDPALVAADAYAPRDLVRHLLRGGRADPRVRDRVRGRRGLADRADHDEAGRLGPPRRRRGEGDPAHGHEPRPPPPGDREGEARRDPDPHGHPPRVLPDPGALVAEGGDEPLPSGRGDPPAERAPAVDALARAVVREREAGGAAVAAHALLRLQDPPLRALLDELRLEPA